VHPVLEVIPNLLFTDNDINGKIQKGEQVACIYRIRLQINTHMNKKKKSVVMLNLTLNFMSQTSETGNDSGWDPYA